jgi:hypothetical protein
MLEPVVTFPKAMLVALAASDPVAVPLVVFAFPEVAGALALVNPVQPDSEKTARRARIVMTRVNRLRSLGIRSCRGLLFGRDFTMKTV